MGEQEQAIRSVLLVRQTTQLISIRASLIARGLAEITKARNSQTVDKSMTEAFESFRVGNYAGALAACEVGLLIEPENIALLQIKGVTQVRLGQYSHGLRLLDKAVECDPQRDLSIEIRNKVVREMGSIESRGDMKQGIKKIVGKRITGLVIRRTQERPGRTHLFLIFSDGTNFELWATDEIPGELAGCSDLDKGGLEEVRRYVSTMEPVIEVVDSSIAP